MIPKEIKFWNVGVVTGVMVMSIPSNWSVLYHIGAALALGIGSILISYLIFGRE